MTRAGAAGRAAPGGAEAGEKGTEAMGTPVCDFVDGYARGGMLRLHMPGHKGRGVLERGDITEITGADVLYAARGILRESEAHAAALFGSGRTLFSAEGSSLCIRAMLTLATLEARRRNRAPRIVAGRNAHRTFLSAAALLDLRVDWLWGESLLTCLPTGEELARALDEGDGQPAAVYLTSPDYLGFRADLRTLAAVCHARGVPLLVDNAHGAYLKFLPAEPGSGLPDAHPLTLGADLVCDSAHKTLPVLTGGAYLHIARTAPPLFTREAERAMALHASTSPSWLILRSLDRCNALLAGGYGERLRRTAERVRRLKERLTEAGYALRGDEPLKLTLAPKGRGYTGEALHGLLRARGIECEFADPDSLVMMISPETGPAGLKHLEEALRSVPAREPLREAPPALPRPERVLTPRAAMLSPAEAVPVAESLGRVLADPCVSCPPAVPVIAGGERIDEGVLRCLRYYGTEGPLACVAGGA